MDDADEGEQGQKEKILLGGRARAAEPQPQREQGEGDQPPLEGQFQAGLLLAEDRRLELFADASVGHGSMPASGADKGVLRGPSPRMI